MRIFRKLRGVRFYGRMHAPPHFREPMSTCSHLVEFFSADERLVERVADFMQEGFDTGCTCIAAVTPEHRARIDGELAARGLNSNELIAAYRYIVIDARKTLNSIRCATGFDVAEFHRSFGHLISLAASGGKPVRIVGELVTLLAEQSDADAILQLEEMWNDLSRDYSFTLFCLYSADVCESRLSPRQRNQIRALHSRPAETA
jgi:hypothetical protein